MENIKKIFIISRKLYGYEKIIKRELEKQNYKVTFYDYDEAKKYRKIKNPFFKLYNNLILRKLFGVNLKNIMEEKGRLRDLSKLDNNYDVIIKIGRVFIKEEVKLLKEKGKKLICHYWDTISYDELDKFELDKKYFNKISSYDQENCKEFKLKYLPNFYFEEETIMKKELKDIYCITSDFTKKELLERINEYCIKNKIKADINLVDEKLSQNKSNIKILERGIELEQMIKECKETKAILKIIRDRNRAPSMRTMDCIGLRKKLITNNKSIIKEDFYNSNNILIIDENNINIPNEFFLTPYEELSRNIYEKYNLKNWLKELLN